MLRWMTVPSRGEEIFVYRSWSLAALSATPLGEPDGDGLLGEVALGRVELLQRGRRWPRRRRLRCATTRLAKPRRRPWPRASSAFGAGDLVLVVGRVEHEQQLVLPDPGALVREHLGDLARDLGLRARPCLAGLDAPGLEDLDGEVAALRGHDERGVDGRGAGAGLRETTAAAPGERQRPDEPRPEAPPTPGAHERPPGGRRRGPGTDDEWSRNRRRRSRNRRDETLHARRPRGPGSSTMAPSLKVTTRGVVGDRAGRGHDDDHHPLRAAQKSSMTCPVVAESSAPVGSSRRGERRLADDRAGDRHALPLAAGQLVRQVVRPVLEADARERSGAARARRSAGRTPA